MDRNFTPGSNNAEFLASITTPPTPSQQSPPNTPLPILTNCPHCFDRKRSSLTSVCQMNTPLTVSIF